jgi:hypothetical protein
MPGTILLCQEDSKLSFLVRAAIAPKVEGEEVLITGEGSKVSNEKTHTFERDKELERSVSKLRNTKVRSRTTNGGLKDHANGTGVKAELASSKSNHKSKRSCIRS